MEGHFYLRSNSINGTPPTQIGLMTAMGSIFDLSGNSINSEVKDRDTRHTMRRRSPA